MELMEFDSNFRQSTLELICYLQNYERKLTLGEFNERPPGSEIADKQLKYLVNATNNEQSAFYLAIENNRAVGLIVLFVESEPIGTHHLSPAFLRYALVSDFVVAPDYQGKGVADILMAQAERFALDNDLPSVRLSVLANNQLARSYYEKYGFSAHEIAYSKSVPPKNEKA
jgi:ribosomal protein S18 acetylase RimI-like enzyme